MGDMGYTYRNVSVNLHVVMEAAVVAATSSVKQTLEISEHLSVKQRSRPVACKSVALSVVVLPLGTKGNIGDVCLLFSSSLFYSRETATIRSLVTLHLGWFKILQFLALSSLTADTLSGTVVSSLKLL
jgi:hypothetical protein